MKFFCKMMLLLNLFVMSIFLSGCGDLLKTFKKWTTSNATIAVNVELLMQEQFNKSETFKHAKIVKCTVIQEKDNNYKGHITVSANGKEATFAIKAMFDGQSVGYTIPNDEYERLRRFCTNSWW